MPTDRGRAFGASRREKGRLAEAAVRGQFRALGFSVLAANYFLPSVGELDLVLNRGCFLYFGCPVKSAFGPICRDPNRRGAGSASGRQLRRPAVRWTGAQLLFRRRRCGKSTDQAAAHPPHGCRCGPAPPAERYWPAFWAVGR